MCIHDHQPTNSTVLSGFGTFLLLLPALTSLALILAGCVTNGAREITILKGSVRWEGYIFQDRELLAAFDGTLTCLGFFQGTPSRGYPYVVKVADHFVCGSTPDAVGCTDFLSGRIYLVEDFSSYAINHELVHWATGLGNAAHGQEFMNVCGRTASVEAAHAVY